MGFTKSAFLHRQTNSETRAKQKEKEEVKL